ncbi:MAG: hypothetical protein V4459_02015 [Pseudomonadota bacterium]
MRSFRIGCVAVVGTIFMLLLAAVGWFFWQGSEASLPPLGKGMPGTSFAEGNRVFKQRVARLYPVGSSARRLESDLREQGFSIRVVEDRPGQIVHLSELHRFIGCGDKVWEVDWRAAVDALTEVSARYGPVCM